MGRPTTGTGITGGLRAVRPSVFQLPFRSPTETEMGKDHVYVSILLFLCVFSSIYHVLSMLFLSFFHRYCGKAVLNRRGKMVIQLSRRLLKKLPGRETVNALVVSLFSVR